MATVIEQVWEPENSGVGGHRARLRFTHQAHVPDLVADLELPLAVDVMQVLTEADRGIAALNHAPSALASFDILARQLLRAESVASSRIEGLQLSHRRLAQAAFSDDASRADLTAASVLGNIAAMQAAVELGRQRRFGPAPLREPTWPAGAGCLRQPHARPRGAPLALPPTSAACNHAGEPRRAIRAPTPPSIASSTCCRARRSSTWGRPNA